MRMQGHLLLFVVLGLAGCAPEPQPLDPYAVLPGTWGWEASDDCQASPEEISFSDDRKQMYLAHAPANEQGIREPRRKTAYKILGATPNGLSMAMKGEDRLDLSGKPVTWELVLLDQDQYCWHRNDWRPTGCTKSVRRCKS